MERIFFCFTLVTLLAGQGMAQSVDPQKLEKTDTTQEIETVKLKVSGLTCAGCASHLYKVLEKTNGVMDNSVEYPGDIAVVEYDPKQTSPKKIIATIEEKTSYKAVVLVAKNEQ